MGTVNLTTSMSSVLSAMKTIEATMDKTNERLATGLKVNSALDDPLAFFAAEDHTDQADTLSLLNDDMNEAIQTINAADEGIEAIKDLLDDAKALCNSCLSSDDDDEISGYMTQINAILSDIDDLAGDSGYAGVNLLADDDLDVVFDESGTSKVTLDGFSAEASDLDGDLVAVSGWTTTNLGGVTTFLNAISDAKSELRTHSKELSSQLSVITTRQEFTEGMIDVLETGSANLVNADLSEESANLLALETQQSLATNSLSIASSSMQSVLNLF